MAAVTSALLIAFHDGLGEATTPTANFTPVSGYPLANLTNSRLHSRTRTAGLTDQQLTWDFGSAQSINVAAIFGTNLTVAATRRVRIASDSGFTTSVVESGGSLTAAFDTSLGSLMTYAGPGGRSLVYVFDQDYSRRYARWHVTDAANPDSYLEFGIARFGVGFQPGRTFDEDWEASSELVGAVGAQQVIREHELTIKGLTESEAFKLETLARGVLANRRILVLPRPLSPETWLADAIWCVLKGVHKRRFLAGTGSGPVRYYRVTLTFREVDE